MTVLPAMVNGLGVTNCGAIFTFANTTFSLASNTYNERTVAAHCCISFLLPTKLGDRLVATATEVVRSARSGIYDVSVTLENAVVAEFRAHSRVIGGALLPVVTVGQSGTTRSDEGGGGGSAGGSSEGGDRRGPPKDVSLADSQAT